MDAKICIIKEKVFKLLNISEQLMYLPPKGSIPENNEVKILIVRILNLNLTHSDPGK